MGMFEVNQFLNNLAVKILPLLDDQKLANIMVKDYVVLATT
jgi:hypothetical protein